MAAISVKNLFRSICFLALCYSGATVAALCRAEVPELNVGFIATLTGPRASMGQDALCAAEVAVEEVRSRPSWKNHKLSLVVEDSRGDPRTGVDAYKKLRAQRLRMVLTQNSNVSLPISELVNRDSVLQLAYCTTADAYSRPNDLTFRVNGTTVPEARLLADTLKVSFASHPGALAIVTMEDQYPLSVKKHFTDIWKKQELPIDLDEVFVPKETDFRALLTKIKRLKDPQIVLLSYQTEAGYFMKQLIELGMRPSSVLGINPIDNKEFFDTVQQVDGMRILHLAISPAHPAANRIHSRCKRPANWFAGSAYDAVHVAATAIEECRFEIEPRCLALKLTAIKDFDGLNGRRGFDDEFGDMSDSLEIYVARGGGFGPLNETRRR